MSEDKFPIPTQSRRNVLKTVGTVGIFTTAGLSSTVSASSNGNEPQSWEAIRNQITQARKNGGAEDVKQVLQRHDIDYDLSITEPEPSDDDGLGTEGVYSESDSELLVLVNPVSGYDDRVRLSAQMQLEETHYNERKAWRVDDAIGITFDSSHWSIVGEPVVTATEVHEADWYSGSPGSDGLVGAVDLGTEGIISTLPESAYVTLEAVLEHQSGSRGTLWGHYDHTRSLTSSSSITVTVGVGGFDVSVSLDGTTTWSAADPVDPEQVL